MSALEVSLDTITCLNWSKLQAGYWSFAATVQLCGGVAGCGLVFDSSLVWSRFGGRPQWHLLVPGRELKIYGEEERELRERVIDELHRTMAGQVLGLPPREGE